MFSLRGYDSPVLAQAAAEHLLLSGVPARVFHDSAHTAIPRLHAHSGTYTVAIVYERDRDRAARLLEQLDAEPVALDDNWEAQAQPDLSLLRPEDQPACPACAWPLPAEASLDRCDRCGTPVDVVELIVAQRGPEALEPCYAPLGTPHEPREAPEPGPGLEQEQGLAQADARSRLGEAAVPCRSCGYDLAGLPAAGRCPECGTGYDKLRVFRDAPGPRR